jgi:hypothetical protein
VAHGDVGLIHDEELVVRVVCDPRHIAKKDGSIKPSIFPPSHIAKKGLSMMRPKHLTAIELKLHADAVASHHPKDTAVGVIEGEASKIRALVDEGGERLVCLFEDPVIDEPGELDNPAHALLVVARELSEDDIAEIRTKLTLLFGPLRRFAA